MLLSAVETYVQILPLDVLPALVLRRTHHLGPAGLRGSEPPITRVKQGWKQLWKGWGYIESIHTQSRE